MALRWNLRHLERHPIKLTGEITAADLDIENVDPVIHFPEPLRYEIEAELIGRNILAKGSLQMDLDCECVRCLKRFRYPLRLDNWMGMFPLDGEECVAVDNDCVDLTEPIREDILLAFPRHPLCNQSCRGLSHPNRSQGKTESEPAPETARESAWNELNKLKF
jgi:uncharacterized metal-binding protein YceD (DUF177 family)